MNTLKKQFQDALKREGTSITTYFNNDTVPCIFRINADTNKETDRIQIFYSISSPINQGQLITFRNRIYLVLNQETAENDIYYKSSIIQTNAELKWTTDSVIYKMPCYAGDLVSYLPNSGDVVTVGGNIEIQTEDRELSRQITLNQELETMGGVYKIVNFLYRTGFTYLYAERTAGTPTPPLYVINITGASSYDLTEVQTANLTVEATIDGVPESNPTVTWTSSNESVATVSNGVLTFIASGTATITATWVEGNVSDTLDITVTNSTSAVTYTITVSNPNGDNKIYTDEDTIIYLYPYANGVQTNAISVSYELIGESAGMFTKKTYDAALYKLTLNAAVYGKQVTVRAYNTEHEIEASRQFNLAAF